MFFFPRTRLLRRRKNFPRKLPRRREKTTRTKTRKRRRKKKRRRKRRRRAMLIPLAPCPKSLPMTCEAWTRW